MALKKKAARIELLVLDVDGVLTDGRLYFTEQGEEFKAFDTQDGHGIKMWRQVGGRVAIITGRQSQLVQHRARNLGIDTVMQGREDKGQALQELVKDYKLALENVAYVGDDLPDLAAMRLAGLGIAVANAHPWVREHADMVTTSWGGRGAVREVCDFLLDTQGKLDALQAHYLGS